MINRITNKNGVKLLAAIAVFAIALVGLSAVPAVATDCDATGFAADTSAEVTKEVLEINNKDDLIAFANSVNEGGNYYFGKTVNLKADIDLEGEKWTPVGQTGGYGAAAMFCGTFNGNDHTISNMTIVLDSWNDDVGESLKKENDTGLHGQFASGFFGFIDAHGATIKDITFENANVTGHHYVGVVAGYVNGVIENCDVRNSTITNIHEDDESCGDKTGTIAGYVGPYDSKLTECTAKDCKVFGARDAGQLVGCADIGTIFQDCGVTNVTVSKEPTKECRGTNIVNDFAGRVDGSKGYKEVDHVRTYFSESQKITEDTDANFVLKSKDAKITIVKGATYSGAIVYENNRITFKNLKAGEDVTIAPGSLTISGTIDASQTVEITASGEIKINNVAVTVPEGSSTTTESGLTITADGSVDTTVSITGNLTVGANATLVIGCTIESGDDTAKITNNGKIVQETGADLSGIPIEGKAVINDSNDSEMSSVSVGGESDIGITTFPAKQIVTVNGSWTLINGANITIKGKLVVPEGATLTIEAGAKLTLDNNAIAEIDGTVVIAENDEDHTATFNVKSGDVTVEGDLQIAGAFVIEKGKLTVKSGSDASVEETGSLKVGADGNVIIEKSASFDIYGAIDAAKIKNNGTLTFDSKVPSEKSTITMEKNGVLNIVNLTAVDGGELEVVDKQNNSVTITVGTTGAAIAGGNIVATVSGLKVNEKFIAETISEGTDKYSMIVTGDLGVTYSYIAVGSEDEPAEMSATATIAIQAVSNATEIAEGLTIGEKVTVKNEGALIISSTVDATKGTFQNSGILTISGEGIISVKALQIISETDVNATKYTVGTGANAVTYYVTIDKALATANAGTATDFTVVGKQTVSASATLPAKTKLDVTGSTFMIGTSEKTDITLTIASGATVKESSASEIIVHGTLYAEDKTNIISAVRENIISDVYSEQIDEKEKPVRNGWAKWTNVYSALSEASENQIIKASNNLTISKDLVIPAGVVLDTNGHEMEVNEDVVVTVNGTLFVNGKTVKLAVATEDGKKAAEITVSGFVKSDSEIEDAVKAGDSAYAIPGAYYSIDSVNYVTTVENAAKVITTTYGQTVILKGGEITTKDVTFTGTGDKVAHIIVKTKVKFGTFTLDEADITFENQSVEGTITNSVGTVKILGQTSPLKFISSNVGEVKTLTATGTLEAQGTVNSEFEVTGTVSVEHSHLDSATVEGTLNVIGTTTINTLLVNGTVVVTEDGSLDSTTATIMGTISAEEGEAKATIKAIFIGITEDYATVGASATVVGNITLATTGYALVEPSSSVTEKITKDSTAKTEFYIDNVLYLTAFVNEASDETIDKKIVEIDAHIEDARFEGWYHNGTKVNSDVRLGAMSSVSAEIELDIYEINIVVGAGIENIAIDGVIYDFEPTSDCMTVVAGTHTVSYTLKSNYSGTPTLTVNGEKQSGMTFITSGTPSDSGNIKYNLQLSGVAASEPTTPVTPVQPIVTSDDDGMGLTEYLLIVLVVLAAILVIIVSIRMMRS